MFKGMEQASVAEIIKRLARSLKIWCISIDSHTERVWWFKRLDEDQFVQRNLSDEQAIRWLQDESFENLRDLKLDDWQWR